MTDRNDIIKIINALFIVEVHLAIKVVHRHPTFSYVKEMLKLNRNMI